MTYDEVLQACLEKKTFEVQFKSNVWLPYSHKEILPLITSNSINDYPYIRIKQEEKTYYMMIFRATDPHAKNNTRLYDSIGRVLNTVGDGAVGKVLIEVKMMGDNVISASVVPQQKTTVINT